MERQQIIDQTQKIFDELFKNICEYYNNHEFDKMFLSVDKARVKIKEIMFKMGDKK